MSIRIIPSRVCAVACASLCLSALNEVRARADGVFLPEEAAFRARREKAMIYEPEQKAAIFYRNGVEDLIISPRFSGPAARFAWIIPAPSRPTAAKLDGALFHELAALTYPRRMGKGTYGGDAKRAGTEGVTVLERKQVGAYDVAVLQAGDSRALMGWLTQNGFAMTPAAEAPIRAHIVEGWTFVAARVNIPEAQAGLNHGTLAPIHLTFRTSRPIYPLRVSGANGKPFLVQVHYIRLLKAGVRPASLVVDGPKVTAPIAASFVGDPAKNRAPTVAKLANGNVAIYLYSQLYEPRECLSDLAFVIRE